MSAAVGRTLRCAALLAAGTLVAGVSRADGSEALDAWVRARTATPDRLRAHAAWCAEKKLARERLVAFERILALVPDDAEARRALRWVKTKDGSWKRAKTDDPPASPADLAEEAAKRLEDAVAPLRKAAVAVFEDTDLPMGRRELAMDDRLALGPDDPEVRAANGETQSGGRWVLDETLRAKERGAELRAAAAAAKAASAAPESVAATDEEASVAGRVAETFASDVVRVVGAEGTREAKAAASVVAAARPLWRETFAADAPPVPGLTFLLFPTTAAGHAALDRDATLTADDRTWMKSLASAWRPRRNQCLVWDAEPPNRVEWALRQSVQVWLRTSFEVSEKRAWAYEGIGHWFSEVLLASHHCTFVRRPDYADAGGADARAERLKLLRASQDWMVAARDLSARPEWPGVRSVLGKDVNGLAPDELLVSYALARYVIEGRASSAAVTFTDAGRGMAPDAWSEGRLDATVEGLDRRLRRWIREMGEK